jgi:hypothetical protein
VDPLQVVNLGLQWIGKDPIASLDNPSGKVAERVAAAYAGLRDAVLEEGDWSFAISRLSLNKDAAPPSFGFTARFVLPANVLRVISAEEPAGSAGVIDAFAASLYGASNGLEWQKEGRHIVANTSAATLNIRAVVQVVDSALWSPGFCQALAARIAAEFAVPMTENRSLQADMWKLYSLKLGEARLQDGRQGRSERLRANKLALRRR